jgi:hypothetical protein
MQREALNLAAAEAGGLKRSDAGALAGSHTYSRAECTGSGVGACGTAPYRLEWPQSLGANTQADVAAHAPTLFSAGNSRIRFSPAASEALAGAGALGVEACTAAKSLWP